MKKVLVTGATDGIGKGTAETLLDRGHDVILHGRSAEKIAAVAEGHPNVRGRYVADLSVPRQVRNLAAKIREDHHTLDALINNAGVLKPAARLTAEGIDARFAVNTLAPYLLARSLLPLFRKTGRIVNVCSAAQAPVALTEPFAPSAGTDMEIYAQSKRAQLIWTRVMARATPEGPAFIAVNPGSLLATKMVREDLGLRGRSPEMGVQILCEIALGDSVAGRSGAYYDNDKGRFAECDPTVDAQDQIDAVMKSLALHES